MFVQCTSYTYKDVLRADRQTHIHQIYGKTDSQTINIWARTERIIQIAVRIEIKSNHQNNYRKI